ncbi:MAG: DciA family protein [Pyrinomonadaceae bacterium]
MEDIFGSFSGILKELDSDGETVQMVVFAAWKRCVDGALAENLVPHRLERNRLIVAVPNETWRRNVADLGPALASKLNTAAGAQIVRFIEFQVDALGVLEHRKRSDQPAVFEADPVMMDRIAEMLRPAAVSITDTKLRETFLGAAAKSLARPRK